MLYHLFSALDDYVSVFNVFRYITFRTAYASGTGLMICLFLGPWMIRRLREFQVGQQVRDDGPKAHQSKSGTPTMGGLLIIISILVPTLLWADLTNPYVWIALAALVLFGVVGFLDDYLKVIKKRSLGLTAPQKIVMQLVISGALAGTLILMAKAGNYSTRLSVPFFKDFTPEMDGVIFGVATFIPLILFTLAVLVATSNTVNLTDGLDGLAAGLIIVAASALTVLTYVTGHAQFAEYLDLIKNNSVSELTIFCGAMVGATMGFLWHNAYPAQIFMGDVGSMSLGGAIGTVAVLIKQELLLFSIGGIFVIEGLSVILQVASFKLTGRRLFRMAPIHHHFELLGWKEPKVVIRFWIMGLVVALISLSTLKLR